MNFRVIKRFLIFTFLLFTFLFIGVVSFIFRRNKIEKLKREFIASVIHNLNIKISKYGKEIDNNVVGVYMSNHRSYLDPIVILNYVNATPVVKRSVKYWPIVGWCISISNAIWVKRSSPYSKSTTKREVVNRVKNKESVLIFPEGTTHLFDRTIGFKKGIFKECAKNNFQIIPISINYQIKEDAWISNDNFIRHFFQCFSKEETHIGIYFHDPIKSNNETFLYDWTLHEINFGMMYIKNSFEGQLLPQETDFVYFLQKSSIGATA